MVTGRVQALVACILHHQDVGGVTPGSVPTDATSIQQEGLRIPPVRLYRGGVPDDALLRMMRANSRMPDNLEGDLAAQWAALEYGAQALRTLIEDTRDFAAGGERALAQSAAAVRAALGAAPDGDYAFTDALDGDGVSDQAVPIEVRLRKRGERLTIDLTHCAAQTQGPINASRGAVWAAVSYFARCIAPQAASNDGCTAPIELLSRPATIVDPAFPAAVNARTNLVKLLANALLGAWAQARPEQTPAPNAGVAVVLSLSGSNAQTAPWLYTEIIASAAGGAPWADGGSGVSTDVGNARSTPAETIEAQAPIRMECVRVRRGSGGAGLHPGGDGVVRAYRLLEGSGVISYRGERHRTAPQGAAGGNPGACGRARIERANGTVDELPAKARAVWHAGDRLVIETAGAGGWGKSASARSRIA
jgi:N-methylhydantoinase B